MNPIDDQLNRLLRAAQNAPGAAFPTEPPFGLETVVMAAWREATSERVGFWDMKVLLRGMVLACVIAIGCFLPALKSAATESTPFTDVLQLTDSTLPSDDSP